VAAGRAGPEPAIKIVSPGNDSLVSGPVILRALVDPPTAWNQIAQVALRQRPAGLRDAEAALRMRMGCGRRHQRTPGARGGHASSGARIVDTVRTKAVVFTDHAEVEIVQVTATVTDGRRFVIGLPQTSFRVFEDDVAQKITYFDPRRRRSK
jgi:hypothetical protein